MVECGERTGNQIFSSYFWFKAVEQNPELEYVISRGRVFKKKESSLESEL